MMQYYVNNVKYQVDYTEGFFDRTGEWWQRTGGVHQHRADELLLIECGSSEVSCLGYTKTFQAPFLVFYPHDVPHRQFNNTNLFYRRYLVQYTAPEMEGMISTDKIPRNFFVMPLAEDELVRLKKYMELLMEEAPPEIQVVRRQHLIAILLLEIALMTKPRYPVLNERTAAERQVISEICGYISEHYAESLTLEDFARRYFISRAKLVRMFSEVLGMTVGEYRLNIRIACAKSLLLEGVSVHEVAMHLGYTNVSYFIRQFRRCVGMTPAAYRRNGL